MGTSKVLEAQEPMKEVCIDMRPQNGGAASSSGYGPRGRREQPRGDGRVVEGALSSPREPANDDPRGRSVRNSGQDPGDDPFEEPQVGCDFVCRKGVEESR